MTRTIWLVLGETGEYDDWQDWIVRAFASKDRAERLAQDAKAAADALFRDEYGAIPAGANPFDPNMSMDYTGTIYRVIPVELEEE